MRPKSTILIVEPDDLILGLLERWLVEDGYQVVVQSQRRLADNHIQRVGPHLVIADISDPRDSAPLIRALHKAHSGPILIISARFRRGLGESAEVADQLGVSRILPKPFTRKELLHAVRESIRIDET